MTDATTRRERRDARPAVTPGPQRREAPRRPIWQTALVGLALIAGAIGIGIILTGEGTPEQTETAAVEVEGERLAPIPQGGAQDSAIGQPAPVVAGRTFADDPTSLLAEDEGTLVVFVAHWCPVCQREVPVIVDHLGDDRPDDVRVVAVPTSTDPTQGNYPPSAWLLDAEDWPFHVLVDSPADQIAAAYGVTAFPAFVAVGADGEVKARVTGEIPPAGIDQLLELARS